MKKKRKDRKHTATPLASRKKVTDGSRYLDKEDMNALQSISKTEGTKRFVYPAFGVDFGFPDKPGGLVYEGVPIQQRAVKA